MVCFVDLGKPAHKTGNISGGLCSLSMAALMSSKGFGWVHAHSSNCSTIPQRNCVQKPSPVQKTFSPLDCPYLSGQVAKEPFPNLVQRPSGQRRNHSIPGRRKWQQMLNVWFRISGDHSAPNGSSPPRVQYLCSVTGTIFTNVGRFLALETLQHRSFCEPAMRSGLFSSSKSVISSRHAVEKTDAEEHQARCNPVKFFMYMFLPGF